MALRFRFGRSSLKMVHRTISFTYGEPLLTQRSARERAKQGYHSLFLAKAWPEPDLR